MDFHGRGPSRRFPAESGIQKDFPGEGRGLRRNGTVLQVEDELIQYCQYSGCREPYGFTNCRRGYLGTKAAAAQGGGLPISQPGLVRTVITCTTWTRACWRKSATNFASVANASGVEMLYFDGSGGLQGDHWYYNPHAQRPSTTNCDNKNMLLQASSFSSLLLAHPGTQCLGRRSW